MKCPLINNNQRLAAFALLLGLIALVIGNPAEGSRAIIDTKELSAAINSKSNYILPEDLADRIIKNRLDFRLVDTRTEKEFKKFNISGSENIVAEQLNDNVLQRNEKIIIVSGDGAATAQAWLILKARSYPTVYMLRGGIDGWKENVMFPKLTANASQDEKTEFEKKKNVAFYFGGQPMLASGETVAVTAGNSTPGPKISAPSMAGGKPAAGPKKKKEGC